jgi:hypothetical protein
MRGSRRWTSTNEGVFGSWAFGWVHQDIMRTKLAADQPDRVVIALGTNDLGGGRPPGIVIGDLWTLYTQVETFTRTDGGHPIAYVATVPPVYQPPQPGRPTPEEAVRLRRDIVALNALIRGRFPKDRVIDFDSWMPAEWPQASCDETTTASTSDATGKPHAPGRWMR